MNSPIPYITKDRRRVAKISSLSPITNGIGFAFVLVLSLMTGNLSFAIFWIAMFIGTYLIIARSKTHSRLIFELFSFAFVFYTIYMGITTYLLVKNPNTDFFYAFDSTKFWVRSEGVYSLDEVWKRYSQNAEGLESVGGYRFFYFITLIVSYLSSLIDQNNIYVQKLAVVFVGSLASPYIFLILRKYIDKYYAYLATLIFVVFSHVSTYSVEFLRDSYVYFFYVLGFYLITNKSKHKSTVWKLALISVIVFYIRPEHGVFFMFFVAGHIYINKQTNKLLFLLLLAIAPVVLYLSTFLISMSMETYSTYEDVRQRVGESTESLAARFANFPFGIKHIILAFLSQTVGVPFWRYLYYNGTDIASEAFKSHNGWRFMEAVSGTAWMFVWGYILFAIKRYRHYLRNLPREIVVLVFISFLLLLAGTADINVRRIFCIYPIIFVTAILIRNNLSERTRRIIMRNSMLFIFALYAVYFVLKG